MQELTPQQLAFIAAAKSNNILLKSCAGSGKTTALVAAASELGTGLAISFTKKVAEELQTRMPAGFISSTLNSLGHRACAKLLGRRLIINAKKIQQLCDAQHYSKSYIRVVALAKAYGLVPSGVQSLGTPLVADTDENWYLVADSFDLDIEPGVAREILKASIQLCWRGEFDFDDQLYISALWRAPFEPHRHVLLDEAQDISPIQRLMISRINCDRFSAAGDEHQAIYAFRGADHNSMAQIAAAFKCAPLPLTVSFRCPQEIVLFARQYVSHIEAHSGAPVGVVSHKATWSRSDLQSGDVVLCRNVAPLVRLSARLQRQGVPCILLGRDFGTGLKRLVKKFNCQTVQDFLTRLEKFCEQQDTSTRAERLRERYDTLVALSEGCTTQDQLLKKIELVFGDKQGGVTLSTIHQFKGLERNRVFWLDRWLIPSKYAKTEDELQQERNLAYVAATRAKSELYLVDTRGFK